MSEKELPDWHVDRLPVVSIPVSETGLCNNCSVVFWIRRKRCPRCDGDNWVLLTKFIKEVPDVG